MIAEIFYPLYRRVFYAVLSTIEAGRITVQMPDGERRVFDSGNNSDTSGVQADIHIKSKKTLAAVMHDGQIPFCEGVMDGSITTPDLYALVYFFTVNQNSMSLYNKENIIKKNIRKLINGLRHNSIKGARKNIAAHYDLSNGFYAEWLDDSMTYSSAIFDSGADCLATAQQAKYQRLAELVGLTAGDSVLEIGCGWGGFAEFAATHYDAHITAITISQEQYIFAKNRITTAGLDDKVDIRLLDYRHIDGRFDKIISIEMLEAVGEAYWPVYFQTLSSRLNEGGKIGLQVITIDDARFEPYRNSSDFIQQYIFPGGLIPSMASLAKPIAGAGLKLAAQDGFGPHYAKTLEAWRLRFFEAWPAIGAMGFDERFKNMWELYLVLCQAGFCHGQIDVKQMLLTKQET